MRAYPCRRHEQRAPGPLWRAARLAIPLRLALEVCSGAAAAPLAGCSEAQAPAADASAAPAEVDVGPGRGLHCALCRGAVRPCVCTLIENEHYVPDGGTTVPVLRLGTLRDGPLASADLLGPRGLAVGQHDALYVADTGSPFGSAVRRIAGGKIATIAGGRGLAYKDGPAASARFEGMHDLAMTPSGDVVVAAGYRLRRINAGVVSTLAGDGVKGYRDGPATQARFNFAYSVAAAADGAIYVGDWRNRRIRRIHRGKVTTVAGNGSAPSGTVPEGPALQLPIVGGGPIAVGPDGTVYFAQDVVVSKLQAGRVSTVAGSVEGYRDGPGRRALFDSIWSIAVGRRGEVYVADANDVIRVIENGRVRTYAGVGSLYSPSFVKRDGPARRASFSLSGASLAVDSRGLVYVAEGYIRRIRVILP